MRGVPESKYTDSYYDDCEGITPDGMPGNRLKCLLGQYEKFSGQLVGKTVLDCGCGRGEVAKAYGELNMVFSVDYSYSSLGRFQKNNADKQLFLRHDVSMGMPWLKDEYFDVVIMADIVEHIYPEQLKVLGEDAVRVSKAGALLLIDTPIMDGGESELHVDIKASAQEVHEYFPGTVIVGTHWYKKPEHCNIVLMVA